LVPRASTARASSRAWRASLRETSGQVPSEMRLCLPAQ
jgi:hypothetical protein